MLELKNIKKSYKTGNFIQHALKGVSLVFDSNEFVAILGASGSGKTTLLNIIGGLDRYDSGDLIINDKSTKKFNDTLWDAYRNNCVGFIFQSYNLIGHLSILENVEMSLTLSGVSSSERRKRAVKALEKVGLKEHTHKKPNQLSGGQMQRVAIARALVNDPQVILADEPTGALDTKTSKQIMELIKEISKEKLVIMVTHNPELAKDYASRIIEVKDGEVIKDSKPTKKFDNNNEITIKKTRMSFFTALKLSFNNIKTKKGRTFLTAFASSIGIIGIGIILSLSNGFDKQIDNFEKNSLSQAPIIISTQAMSMSEENLQKIASDESTLEKYPSKSEVYMQEDIMQTMMHTNVITSEYLDYLKNVNKEYLSGVSYQTPLSLNIINKSDSGYNLVNGSSNWTLLPTNPNNGENGIIENNYDVLAGEIKEDESGLILQVDSRNRVYESSLVALGLSGETVSFEEIMNATLKVAINDEYYVRYGGAFIPNQDLENLYNSENSVSLKVQAIIRGKEDKEMITNGSGFAYTNALTEMVILKNKDSKIVEAQRESNYNVLTNQAFDDEGYNTKEFMLASLGGEAKPNVIMLYPKDFENKEKLLSYLDEYNKDKKEEDTIQYTDMASMISSLSGGIMDAITIVLIAFSGVSLVVSSIMIGIITYISVLERTKEIGVLRALGARRKDVSRVFNAETFIIGVSSGVLGIIIARLLVFPINQLLYSLTDIKGIAVLNPVHALILIIISTALTLLGGSIPARIASKKDPVIALRTE